MALIAALLGLSAFFSGSETALFSISAIQRDRLGREKSSSGKRILFLLKDPRKLIVTILMGNEFVNVSISAISAGVFYAVWQDKYRWAPVIILTVIILIFGEIAPKSVAISRPMFFSRSVSLPLKIFFFLITPARFLIVKLVSSLTSAFGAGNMTPRAINQAEFRQLAATGVKEGQLDKEEADMIYRVFDLGQTAIRQIMTPRTEIEGLPLETTLDDAIIQIKTHHFSRMPIYNQTIDNITGVLHANDLLKHSLSPSPPSMEEISRPCFFVPGSMKGDDLLRNFRDNKSHLAIVIDEFGGTAGLVTLDDVLHELFEELYTDKSSDDFTHRVCDNGELIIAGAMSLSQFGRIVDLDFSNEKMETIGGLVFDRFGHLPERGDIIVIEGLKFTVLKIKENRVWRLRISKGITT